ncbi:MAG: endonuclease III domain-containing protein [Candidatus Methanoculleus thermohydrogenotrophicum]
MATTSLTSDLFTIYDALHAAFGHQHWWPAKTPFETMIGAILTQSVSWKNAARAVKNLEAAGMLDPRLLATADTEDVARYIVPSRFYNQKAERIREFSRIYVAEFQADPAVMAAAEMGALRRRLLAIKGFGEETVDTILLYACGKPIFVVDAYTRRIFSRYGLLPEKVYLRSGAALSSLTTSPLMWISSTTTTPRSSDSGRPPAGSRRSATAALSGEYTARSGALPQHGCRIAIRNTILPLAHRCSRVARAVS